MMKLCCSGETYEKFSAKELSFEEAKTTRKLNTYTTTLHGAWCVCVCAEQTPLAF